MENDDERKEVIEEKQELGPAKVIVISEGNSLESIDLLYSSCRKSQNTRPTSTDTIGL